MTDVYETYKYATFDALKQAWRNGEFTPKQISVLLCRKGYTGKQARLIVKGWE